MAATLLAWCAENRLLIDATLQIVDGHEPPSIASDKPSREHGLSVYSREGMIECGRTLVYIPKTAVLSVKSCFFSQRISSVPCGHGAHLSLALALYGELLLGACSRWYGYLESLPRETVDIAVFWGVGDAVETRACTCLARGRLNTDDTSSVADEREASLSKCSRCVWSHDGQNAREWLEVTEAGREKLGLMEEIRQYYRDVVEPTFHWASTNPGLGCDPLFDRSRDIPGDSTADTSPGVYGVTFLGFCHAYSLVSTRAFWVDAYHGLAMVPIADAFNHTNDNHVQMESDYDVCVECGSLTECEHDREIEGVAPPALLPSSVHPLSHDGASTSSEIDYLEMRTVRPIPPFSEVFNTYGPLSNAALLSRYGFMLPENEYDTVRVVLDPLSTMKNLFESVPSVREDDHAVTEASTFDRFAIRNACREREPYSQGIVDNEAPPSLFVPVGALETTNRLFHVFSYVASEWSSEATWDQQGDGLVFNPQSSLARPILFQTDDAPVRIAHDLVINTDGKLEPSLGTLIERIERGPEGIASLTEFKARLINVQRYVERLCHIHDRDSYDGDMEGGDGNHGSTFSPPFPHLAPSPPNLDYDTESDEFAQPVSTTVEAQPRPAITSLGGPSTSVTTGLGVSSLRRDPFEPHVIVGRSLETGPQDYEISTSFSLIPQASTELSRSRSISCHPTLRETGGPYQETSSESSMNQTTGYRAQRDRGRSAEEERPPKRVRRYSDAIVANRVDRLSRTTSESARRARNREIADTSNDEDAEVTDNAIHQVALLLARTVVTLCRDRYLPPTVSREQRGLGMTAAELGDVLDNFGSVSCFIAAKISAAIMTASSEAYAVPAT